MWEVVAETREPYGVHGPFAATLPWSNWLLYSVTNCALPLQPPQGSIVHSLINVGVEADFQILVSIYNPNILDAKIESGSAVLYHKHTEVQFV